MASEISGNLSFCLFVFGLIHKWKYQSPAKPALACDRRIDAESASMSKRRHDAYIATPCVVSHTPALGVVHREHPANDYGTETTMQTGCFQELLLGLVIFAADISISDANTGGSFIWKYIYVVYNTTYDAILCVVVLKLWVTSECIHDLFYAYSSKMF